MDSVVATVSGYHGSERFKLIKLISKAGASYVGAMNQSITHLVCWKFEGRKYELARKLKITVVNHRWIEECINNGRRLPENPFTLKSGKEVGPLKLAFPLSDQENHRPFAHCNELEGCNVRFIDVECEETGGSLLNASTLLTKDLSPRSKKGQSFTCKKRKLVNKQEKQDNPSNGGQFKNSFAFDHQRMEFSELSSEPKLLICKRKGEPCGEPSHRRRLVKKNIAVNVIESSSDSEQECAHNYMASPSTSCDDRRNKCKLKFQGQSESMILEHLKCTLEDSNDVEEIEGLDNILASKDLNKHADGTSSSIGGGLEDRCSLSLEPSNDKKSWLQSTSTELSCVICWTNFSLTRGILPCGHRFCFSCIQSWADHKASNGKISTCPLCKASFVCITKVDGAMSSDQKTYSQTIPNDSSGNVYILPESGQGTFEDLMPQAPACSQCRRREPEDLLVRCHLCQIRCIHSYCLDPPLFPWTCTHCKDHRGLYNQLR